MFGLSGRNRRPQRPDQARCPPIADRGDVWTAAEVLVLHLPDRPPFDATKPAKLQLHLATGDKGNCDAIQEVLNDSR